MKIDTSPAHQLHDVMRFAEEQLKSMIDGYSTGCIGESSVFLVSVSSIFHGSLSGMLIQCDLLDQQGDQSAGGVCDGNRLPKSQSPSTSLATASRIIFV